ncbi:putative ribosomal protein P2 [Dioscorea sansibarensis]
MKVIAAYLLALLGGNGCPSADDLKKILSSVGAEADEDRIEFLLSEVKGKDITELVALGREKFASVPSGGGAAIAVAAPAGGAVVHIWWWCCHCSCRTCWRCWWCSCSGCC